jgi:hypothetical protein
MDRDNPVLLNSTGRYLARDSLCTKKVMMKTF